MEKVENAWDKGGYFDFELFELCLQGLRFLDQAVEKYSQRHDPGSYMDSQAKKMKKVIRWAESALDKAYSKKYPEVSFYELTRDQMELLKAGGLEMLDELRYERDQIIGSCEISPSLTDPLDQKIKDLKKAFESGLFKGCSPRSLLPNKNPALKEGIRLGTKKSIINVGLVIWQQLHPRISRTAKSRFEAKQYADAVEASLKEINTVVKSIVRRERGKEYDGADLMNRAFSLNDPVIILDNLSTQSGRDIQQGYMQIFAGAMTGIRNPKAHRNVRITPQRAIHLLFLASLLMYKLDECQKLGRAGKSSSGMTGRPSAAQADKLSEVVNVPEKIV